MQKIITSTALVFAGALLLAGCASNGGGSTAETTAASDECATVQPEVRDISNGAQNVLGAGGDPTEIKAALDDYAARVEKLDESPGDNAGLSDALGQLDVALSEASSFADTLPTDPDAEVDSDAVAEQQTAIQEAADGVNDVCAG
jgi:hypothetical protein